MNLKYSRPSDNMIATMNPTVTVPAGTVEDGYEAAYLADFSDANLGRPLRLTTTSGRIVIDFGAPVHVPFALLWHNFDADLAVRIQANDADDWAAPPLDEVVTIASKRRNGYTKKAYVELADEQGYEDEGYRYWSIAIALTGPANSVPVGLKLWFGVLREVETNFDLSVPISRNQLRVSAHTDTGYAWTYQLPATLRAFQGTIIAGPEDQQDIYDLADEAQASPFPIIFDHMTEEALLVRFVSSPNPMGEDGLVTVSAPTTTLHPRDVGGAAVQLAAAFVEVTAGSPEWT